MEKLTNEQITWLCVPLAERLAEAYGYSDIDSDKVYGELLAANEKMVKIREKYKKRNKKLMNILELGNRIEKNTQAARDWGNEVQEIYKMPDGKYFAVCYNDAYPDGIYSENTSIHEIKHVGVRNVWERV